MVLREYELLDIDLRKIANLLNEKFNLNIEKKKIHRKPKVFRSMELIITITNNIGIAVISIDEIKRKQEYIKRVEERDSIKIKKEVKDYYFNKYKEFMISDNFAIKKIIGINYKNGKLYGFLGIFESDLVDIVHNKKRDLV